MTTKQSLADTLPNAYAYSFCSLVTDIAEYDAMVAAFESRGFTSADCEFLYADNTASNRFDAFSAYNRFLVEARGRHIVLCHQDVLPLTDDRARLDALLGELYERDPAWALAGNAGGSADGTMHYRITHGAHIELNEGGPFPARVMSLDENFIVVRRDANLALSRDLSGFHWYGSDLCVVADVLGWTSYVIDFHLFHRSTGRIARDFVDLGQAVRVKFARAFRPRWQYVPTRRPVYLSSSALGTFVARSWRRVLRELRVIR
jgi:hypothetical protein